MPHFVAVPSVLFPIIPHALTASNLLPETTFDVKGLSKSFVQNYAHMHNNSQKKKKNTHQYKTNIFFASLHLTYKKTRKDISIFFFFLGTPCVLLI